MCPGTDLASVPAIAVDSNEGSSEEESTYGSDNDSYTTSLASSVLNYTYENGRRYHAYRAGQYVLPNDETEQDRLDMMHHIYSLFSGGEVAFAPLSDNPQRILDVGTGTGIWCIDAGDRYPSAEVIGTDLSPIQPSWVPPNVRFIVDDAEAEWTFTRNSFDLIHVRALAGGIKDWRSFLEVCYQHVRPGGYIEVAEYEFNLRSDDGTYNDKTAMWSYYEQVNKAAETSGRPLHVAHKLGPLLEEAGFVDLQHIIKKLPLGSWPADKKNKELGRWFMLVCETGFEAFGAALLTRVAKKNIEDVHELIRDVQAEIKSRKIHAYNVNHIYYARKPE